LELATWADVRLRSALIVTVSCSRQSCCILKDGEETNQRWEGVPGPEGNHEAEPREEKDTAMAVERVEDGHTPGLVVNGIDHGRQPEVGWFEAHGVF
jgi:hypothetical protein